MTREIENLIGDVFKIKAEREYHFRTLYGFTFVFKEKIVHRKDEILSGEIKPVAIIYEENGQYYLAPIDGAVEIDEVVKEFVEKSYTSQN